MDENMPDACAFGPLGKRRAEAELPSNFVSGRDGKQNRKAGQM